MRDLMGSFVSLYGHRHIKGDGRLSQHEPGPR